MELTQIIDETRRIILKHASPQRIYLYGSRVTGEANANSDVDIAFDDPDLKSLAAIESEVQSLPTLLKVDVTNLAMAEERFRNRVRSTGRVVFSASKQLRAEDGLYNFTRALERFQEAVRRKGELEQEGFGDIFLDLAVKRFEFTYEMAWKAIKRYLDHVGLEGQSPRACFREAYSQGLVTEEAVWLEMIEQRNLTSHVYNQDEVAGILGRLEDYEAAFELLRGELSVQLAAS